MELTIPAIIAAVGILFGLNFLGLFVAAYVFDRGAVHVLWYLAAAIAFMANGAAYLASQITASTAFFLAWVEILQGFGFIALGYGLARAFDLPLNERFLWALLLLGSIVSFALMPYDEIYVPRLVMLSLWHATVAGYFVVLLLRAEGAGFQHRFLAFLIAGVVLAALSRPPASLFAQTIPYLSYDQQIATYASIVNLSYLVALFSIGAGVFFHVMSDLAAGYRDASITDSLTGLLNRRGFIDTYDTDAARTAALIMLDIDHFKSINDQFGHSVGDRVIAAVGTILKNTVGRPYLCGRLGGEEFAVVLQHATLPAAEAHAQAIRSAIEIELADQLPDGRPVTASLGVAHVDARGLNAALRAADHALYEAKNSGRNRVCVSAGEMVQHTSRTGDRRGQRVDQNGTITSTM